MAVQPFNTPDELQQKADRFAQLQTGLFDLDYSVKKMGADNDFQKGEIEHNLKLNVAGTIDNMIARGLGQSSVKDGEINDLNATAAIRKQYLDTTLNAATIDAQRRASVLNDQYGTFLNTLNQMAVGHASDLNANQPPTAPVSPGSVPNTAIPGSTGSLASSMGQLTYRPSAAHGGAVWIYRTGANGELIPVKAA